MTTRKWQIGCGLAAVLLLASAGCTEFWLNQTASLGGSTVGSRGNVQVLIINNTPHRAVFTVGTYDQTDRTTEPPILQVGLDDSGEALEGDSQMDIFTLRCARVFSVGGPKLLEMIQENLDTGSLEAAALIEGVNFYRTDTDDGEPELVGSAPALEAWLGVDFPCGALLVLHLEFDDFGPDPFRVDFELIPAESTR
ncbi:MAG TPA: hypothetical protein PKK06_10550 [Phycisphaerae bacterium]|nr:hypothetical protein [Phycisphaerae bacterium]HNU44992.1 hypothetical protein [Phycisphaerae bacterium]